MVKQLTFFWSQKGGVKELGEHISVKICFLKQIKFVRKFFFCINAKIMPDKYVALGFCERVFMCLQHMGSNATNTPISLIV